MCAPPQRRDVSPHPPVPGVARAHGLALAGIASPRGPRAGSSSATSEAYLAAAPARPASAAAASAAPAAAEDGVKVVELTRRCARRSQVRSSSGKQQAPHFYATMEVDMTRAFAFKNYLEETGRKVTVNHLVLRAVVLALVKNPRANCTVSRATASATTAK